MKYAVIETSSYTVPGDERSRTNPGHGYPEHTETSTNIREFDTEDAVISYINSRNNSYSKWKGRVIRFEELNVRSEVSLSLV